METIHDLRGSTYKKLNDMTLYVEIETEVENINVGDRVIINVDGKDIKYIVSDKVNKKYCLIYFQYL